MFIEREPNKTKLLDELNKRYIKDVPLFIIGANFGPFKNKYYLHEHKNVFRSAKDVCFRDNYSAGLFSDLDNVRVAPDIVFGLDVKDYLVKQSKKVFISVLNLERRDELKPFLEGYERKLAEIIDRYSSCDYEVVLSSFCKAEGDEESVGRVLNMTHGGNVHICRYDGNIDEVLRQISSSEVVIGTRFHAIILGLVFEKKVLPIIYSEKTRNTLNDIGFNGKLIAMHEVSKLDASKLEDYLTKYDGIDRLRKEAKGHFSQLDEFLRREN